MGSGALATPLLQLNVSPSFAGHRGVVSGHAFRTLTWGGVSPQRCFTPSTLSSSAALAVGSCVTRGSTINGSSLAASVTVEPNTKPWRVFRKRLSGSVREYRSKPLFFSSSSRGGISANFCGSRSPSWLARSSPGASLGSSALQARCHRRIWCRIFARSARNFLTLSTRSREALAFTRVESMATWPSRPRPASRARSTTWVKQIIQGFGMALAKGVQRPEVGLCPAGQVAEPQVLAHPLFQPSTGRDPQGVSVQPDLDPQGRGIGGSSFLLIVLLKGTEVEPLDDLMNEDTKMSFARHVSNARRQQVSLIGIIREKSHRGLLRPHYTLQVDSYNKYHAIL